MVLTLLHTSKAHCASFKLLRDRVAPGMELCQQVRPDWLDRAQAGISPELEVEIGAAVSDAEGVVICTCTTIGPLAEAAGALRVDWPMMQAAVHTGGPILMAYALDSTWAPSLDLLERALAEAGCKTTVYPLPLTQYWPLFDAGKTAAFAAVIAGEIRQVIASGHEIACVVLAQASMAGAAPLLTDLDVPVLTSPELALKFAVECGASVPIANPNA